MFRLWHLFVLVAVAAWFIPEITICGNCQAELEIEVMQVHLDEQWGKRWACLDCRFIKPKHKANESMRCFIEVDEDFSFDQKHQVGDTLRFRYQYKKFGDWEKEDPATIMLGKFFGWDVEPGRFADGLYVFRTKPGGS